MNRLRYSLLAYIGITIVVFLPILLRDTVLTLGDIPRSHMYYMTYLQESIWEGRLPLWNPYIYLGQPFLANPSIAFWYPATWLFVLLPPAVAFLIHMMFHVVWSMVGLNMFLRRVLGEQQRIAAWLGGLVFGLSGYTIAHVYGGNYDVLAAGSWIGWVLWASMTNTGVLAITIGMQLLSGYATMSLYTLAALGTYWVFRGMKLQIVGGVVLGAFIAAVQLLPNWEFMSRSVRTLNSGYEYSALGSIAHTYFLQLLLPFPFGGIWTPYKNTEVGYWEQAMYVGVVATLLTIIGIACFRWEKNKHIRMLIISSVVVFVFSAWFAMGRYAGLDIYRMFWQYVPLFSMFRIPARFVYLLDVMMACLAAIGFRVMNKAWRAPVIGIVLLELLAFSLTVTSASQPVSSAVDHEVGKMLQSSLMPGERFNTRHPYDFGYDASLGYRVPSVTGYDVTMLRDPYLFEQVALGIAKKDILPVDRFQIPADHRLNRFLSVRYHLEDPKLFDVQNKLNPDQHAVGTGTSAFGRYTIIKNEKIVPLWYIAPSGVSFGTDATLYEAIRIGSHMYESTVGFIKDVPPISGTQCNMIDTEAVAIRKYEPEYIELAIRTACGGYLTGSHVYFPGWSATINDTPIPIYRGNVGFATLVMPEGVHKVILRYRSTYLTSGMMISVVSLALALLLTRGTFSRTRGRGRDLV